jgi:hypothetical protein
LNDVGIYWSSAYYAAILESNTAHILEHSYFRIKHSTYIGTQHIYSNCITFYLAFKGFYGPCVHQMKKFYGSVLISLAKLVILEDEYRLILCQQQRQNKWWKPSIGSLGVKPVNHIFYYKIFRFDLKIHIFKLIFIDTLWINWCVLMFCPIEIHDSWLNSFYKIHTRDKNIHTQIYYFHTRVL